MCESAVENALSPTVNSRVGGTIGADVDDDLSRCHELMSAIETRGPLHKYPIQPSLYS